MNNKRIVSQLNTPESELEITRSVKIKIVLTKLLSPSFKLSDDTLLEKLFSILSDQFKERVDQRKASDLSIYIPWLCLTTKKWSALKKNVKVFVFRIAGLTTRLKTGFNTLVESGLLKFFCSATKDEKNDQSILLGYADLLYAIIEQDVTCKTLLDLGLWRDMIHIALYSSSLYTIRRGQECVSLFVVSLVRSHSVNYCYPIMDGCFKTLCHGNFAVPVTTVDDSPPESPDIPLFPECVPNSQTVLSGISLAVQIMSGLLSAKIPQRNVSELLSRYRISEWAWNVIVEESENVELINRASSLLVHVNGTVIAKTDDGEVEYSVMRGLTLSALQHLQLLAQKHLFSLVLDCCIEYQFLWSKHGGKIIYCEEDLKQETFEIENNLIITQCMPLFICMKVTRVMESDVMDMFADKVFSLSCKETQRVCYVYRDCLREAPDRSVEALCLQGIRSFMRIPSCYSKREQAVMSFQCMMHILKEFVPDEVSDISADCIVAKKYPGENLVSRYPTILTSLLDGLVIFISKFDISWRDSLETICILSFIQSLINNPSITPMLCTKALQLAKVVILKFIPPNLALLVDSIEGSSMEKLGEILHKKCNDIHWEVRDSALEVLQAITDIAKAKFPSFQSLILENDIPSVVVTLMSSDPHPYVRVSAIKCLQSMVKIQIIWDQALYNKKIVDLTLKLLLHETEGIVRHQACLLMNDLYLQQVIPTPQLERIFDTMVFVSCKDLHWETKVGCLDFWQSVISKAKLNQGMMDNEFPSITYSSIKKKIITLDPPEIRSRLSSLLNYLASSGCLLVFWLSLSEDCDLEVVVKAKLIVEDLMSLLNKYDVVKFMKNLNLLKKEEIQKDNDNDISLHMNDEFTINTENKKNVDEVIEEIVSTEDLDLLSKMAQIGVVNRREVPPRQTLSPTGFLHNIINTDLDFQVAQRKKWLVETSQGLISLLDDIISYSSIESNLIDCY